MSCSDLNCDPESTSSDSPPYEQLYTGHPLPCILDVKAQASVERYSVGYDRFCKEDKCAIIGAQMNGKPVIDVYSRLMRNLVDQTRKNQQRGILSFETNEELQAYLDRGMLKMGLNMFAQTLFNRFRSGERQVMIP